MRIGLWLGVVVVLWGGHVGGAEPDTNQKATSAIRGGQFVRTLTSPLAFSPTAYGNLWKQAGLKKPPKDLKAWMLKRYGLVPQSGSDLPLGLARMSPAGMGHNCLICHAGRIAGRTVIGLGNASLDFQTLLDDMSAGDLFPLKMPFTLSNGRGSIEATAGTMFLLRYRDKDVRRQAKQADLRIDDHLCEDLPAWWLLKHKKTIFHLGATDVRALRPNLSFLLAPINSARFVKAHETSMGHIKAYLRSLQAPKYPFAIDAGLAKTGKAVFQEHCSHCHGTYGKQVQYPNKVIALDEIGTDPRLANFYSQTPESERKYFGESWLFAETDKEGKSYYGLSEGGYQAPPLTGVWATAPYFHNGSVPTVYHVLHSKARPQLYTRSYRTDEADYDKTKLGWKFQTLQRPLPEGLSAVEQRKIYDATHKGRGTGGHTFGDDLSEKQRRAVIEYLKTL